MGSDDFAAHGFAAAGCAEYQSIGTPGLLAIQQDHVVGQGVQAVSNGFINDVSPLAEVNYYIYAAIPQELIDTYSTCTVKIGFTENFDYKVIDVNDLPKFENCDDVFYVTLP